MNSLYTGLITRYGAFVVALALIIAVVVAWVVAHTVAEPGQRVSVLWGLAKYIKGTKSS